MTISPPTRRASYTLHIISQQRFDREGNTSFPVTRLRLVRLLDEVIERLEDGSRFRYFTLDGQSILLEDYLAIRPENFERVEALVQNGQLLVGPWYIQPEPFLSDGESLIRNLMIGLRTARAFGRPMLVGYMPDALGQPGQMPQILKGFGIDMAITWRGIESESTELSWLGSDETSILLANLREGLRFQASIPILRQNLAPYSDTGHLFMLHAWSGEQDLQGTMAAAFRELHDDVFESTPADYARAVERHTTSQPLPSAKGEQRSVGRVPIFQGTLSARTWVKRRMYEAEKLLTQWIEPFLAWAEQIQPCAGDTHIRHPQSLIQKLWRVLLENQNPSTLRGVAIDAVYRDAEARFDNVQNVAENMRDAALTDITQHIQTLSDVGEKAIIVFNPSPFPRTDTVIVRNLPKTVKNLPAVYNGEGTRIEARVIKEAPSPFRPPQLRALEFTAVDVPAFGYATYWMSPEVFPGTMPPPSPFAARTQDGEIENDFFKAQLDGETQTIILTDKLRDITYKGLLELRGETELGDAYNYSPAGFGTQVQRHAAVIERRSDGKMLKYTVTLTIDAAYTIFRKINFDLVFTVTLMLPRNVPRLDVLIESQNKQTPPYRVCVHVPTPFQAASAIYDGHFDIIERPICDLPPISPDEGLVETPLGAVPQRAFTAIFEPASTPDPLSGDESYALKRNGLVIANRGTPDVEILPGDDGAIVSLTYARVVNRISRDDLTTRSGHAVENESTITDLQPTVRSMELSVIPTDNTSASDAYRQAWSFSDGPMHAITAEIHDGSLPTSTGLIRASDPAFRITAVKLPEDSDREGMMVRGYNTTDEAVWVTLLPWRKYADVEVTNLDEAPTGGKLGVDADGTFRCRVGPRRIVTFWLHN